MSSNLTWNLSDQSGSTLTESLVALALLMVVLVPTIGFLGAITSAPPASRQATAFHHAHHAMERTLLQESYNDTLFSPAPGWTVNRNVEHDSQLVHITISAFKGDENHPAVKLYTARLAQQEDR